jgi:hypothetical protein
MTPGSNQKVGVKTPTSCASGEMVNTAGPNPAGAELALIEVSANLFPGGRSRVHRLLVGSTPTLRTMAFPDTGPQKDGTRTEEQWFNAMGQDVAIIHTNLLEIRDGHATGGDITRNLAIVLKEARRLESDIYRYAREIHDISKEDIHSIRT